jgi:transcriptional regulator with XRE-family HTH domain
VRQKIKPLALGGLTDVQIAKKIGVTKQTLNNWKKGNPDFFDSLKDWKAEADGKVERSLYERACGYSHPETKIFCSDGQIITQETIKHYPPDPTSMIFWLKNRQPDKWRDKIETEHSGSITMLAPGGVRKPDAAGT